MKDRRKKPRNSDDRRFNNRVFVGLDVVAYFNDEQFDTKMRNMSGNGMQIVEPANAEIEPQQDCYILIKDDDKKIKLQARVVWKDFGLIGLCFQKQNQRIQKQLNNLSNKLLITSMSEKGISGLV